MTVREVQNFLLTMRHCLLLYSFDLSFWFPDNASEDLMTILSWRDDYRIGIKEIDAQHQYLFDLINELHSAHATSFSRNQVSLALTKLIAYAEEHFVREEALMSANSYPKLDQHRQIHEALVSSIFDLNEKFQGGVKQIDAEV
ncbi:MAG: hemerythrin family protein, partial [Hyphomicrobiales bacterium]|nr:hemerythrin family protein [Hyphomicrobiales bacterium]